MHRVSRWEQVHGEPVSLAGRGANLFRERRRRRRRSRRGQPCSPASLVVLVDRPNLQDRRNSDILTSSSPIHSTAQMTKRAHRVSSQYVQCLVPTLAGGGDESSLSSSTSAEAEGEAVAPPPTIHDDHLPAEPDSSTASPGAGGEFNNFDLLRLMAGDTAGVALTRGGAEFKKHCSVLVRLIGPICPMSMAKHDHDHDSRAYCRVVPSLRS